MVDENDVLRDEGETYARRLTQACVPSTSVRYNGTINDFLMLNPCVQAAPRAPPSSRPFHVLRGALGTG